MRFGKSVVLLVCAFIFIGCAPKVQEITIPPAQISKIGFEFTPFNEPGWYMQEPDNQYEVELGKLAPSPNATYAIQIWPEQVPEFQESNSFYDYVKTCYLSQESDSRFEIKELKAEKYENTKAVCTELYFRAIDHDPVKREEYPGDMILEYAGFMCVHPQKRDVAYVINFSYRCHENFEDNTIRDKAKKVFENMNFTNW